MEKNSRSVCHSFASLRSAIYLLKNFICFSRKIRRETPKTIDLDAMNYVTRDSLQVVFQTSLLQSNIRADHEYYRKTPFVF